MNIDAFNYAFLDSHPDIKRKSMRKIRRPKVIVMALKPKYAKAIYEGRKNWEFRKAPPPLFHTIYIYESAPVSAITGYVTFSESITGVPICVMDIVKTNKCYTKNLPGISLPDLETYTGKKLVTALRVYRFERFDKPIPFEGKAPQNWGRYEYIANTEVPTKTEMPTL